DQPLPVSSAYLLHRSPVRSHLFGPPRSNSPNHFQVPGEIQTFSFPEGPSKFCVSSLQGIRAHARESHHSRKKGSDALKYTFPSVEHFRHRRSREPES